MHDPEIAPGSRPSILFEDPHLLVLSKPAGLLSQGEIRGEPNLVDWLRGYLGRPYVGLVHRLDRNTSGVMVVAKRTKSAERLTRALQQGRIFRSYLAWIEGSLAAPARWAHRLVKDPIKNRVTVVGPNDPRSLEGKEAVLSVKPVARGHWDSTPLTLAEFVLETGRSHQIRVQAAKEGHPLLGDTKYGRPGRPGKNFGRPALHSHRIAFDHPMSGARLEFEAPLPPDMAAIARL